MKKTFILGVGAQKSGTSWLYRYLSTQKNSNFGALKEYHIWDALYIKECRNFIAPLENALRYKLQNIDGAYELYFDSLTSDNTNITGDITPSYSGLPLSAFEKIRKKIESARFDIKVIFLMRDPFERCWSAVRMARRNGSTEFSELELLRNSYNSEQFFFRTNYKATIETLESVFESKKIYYGIYEELFSSENVKALSDYCCCPFQPDFAKKKFNVSPKLNDEASTLKGEIQNYYAEVYEFCEDRFPKTRFLWGQ